MTGILTYESISEEVRATGLDVFGAFLPAPEDGVPQGAGTLLLLGPHEPGFWAKVGGSPEFHDGGPDPIDRWSRRAIGQLARALGGRALYPFDGPPWLPFYSWALRSGRAWPSPVRLLVHDRAGLMVSYRGALALPARLDLPPPPDAPPCKACEDQPCRAACPVGALTAEGYEVPACHAFLDTPPGRACLDLGCAVRRACPVSRAYGRRTEQSAHHMRYFHP